MYYPKSAELKSSFKIKVKRDIFQADIQLRFNSVFRVLQKL